MSYRRVFSPAESEAVASFLVRCAEPEAWGASPSEAGHPACGACGLLLHVAEVVVQAPWGEADPEGTYCECAAPTWHAMMLGPLDPFGDP